MSDPTPVPVAVAKHLIPRVLAHILLILTNIVKKSCT